VVRVSMGKDYGLMLVTMTAVVVNAATAVHVPPMDFLFI
jgi:hypothetical protein